MNSHSNPRIIDIEMGLARQVSEMSNAHGEICPHKREQMIKEISAVARPARVLPLPKYPILLIIASMVAGGAFMGGLFFIALSTDLETRQRFFAVHPVFDVDTIWFNRISDYLALNENSVVIVTVLALLFVPFLFFMHWGRTSAHTKFTSAGVVDRLMFDPKKTFTIAFWKFVVFVCHYSYLFFGVPAIFCIILTAAVPENNALDVINSADIIYVEESNMFVGAHESNNDMANPLDWSSIDAHTTFAGLAFALLTMYCTAHALAFWIDSCIDQYTTNHLDLEFFKLFPEVALEKGLKPKKSRARDIHVLTFPKFWSCYLLFLSAIDIALVFWTAIDMSDIRTFEGITPSEWIFVMAIGIHISTIAFALYGAVHRDSKKIEKFVDQQIEGMKWMSTATVVSEMSIEDVQSKIEFLNGESDIHIHAGVCLSREASAASMASSQEATKVQLPVETNERIVKKIATKGSSPRSPVFAVTPAKRACKKEFQATAVKYDSPRTRIAIV